MEPMNRSRVVRGSSNTNDGKWPSNRDDRIAGSLDAADRLSCRPVRSMCRRRRSCHDPSPRSGRSEFPLPPVDESSAGRRLHRPSVAASSHRCVRGSADRRRLWAHPAAECPDRCSTLQAMLRRRCMPPERVFVSDRVRSFSAAHSSTSPMRCLRLSRRHLPAARRLPDSAVRSDRDRPQDSEEPGPVERSSCGHHRA